jgi:hypothetical protein
LDWKWIASQEVAAGGFMIVIRLLSAVAVLAVDQLFQKRYGALGVLCLTLLALGFRTRNTTCLSVGAVGFLLLMVQA